jgi:hypothetical protein
VEWAGEWSTVICMVSNCMSQQENAAKALTSVEESIEEGGVRFRVGNVSFYQRDGATK